MAQEQKQPRKSSETEEATEAPPRPTSPSARKPLDDDVDAILDEIDDVLETNAEDFVKSFIQKGGAVSRDDPACPAAYLMPGTSSFADFLSSRRPTCCPRAAPCRRGTPATWRRTAPRSSPRPSPAAW